MTGAVPTIAVFGTYNRDTTTYADGTRTEQLGGLVYTVLTLAALGAGAVRVLPVANVGADLWEHVCAALAIPGVDLAALQRVPGPNNHVHLTYRDAAEREEILIGRVRPLALEQCAAGLGADAVLVNLTSGCDLELGTLQAFRARYRGSLQLDVHSLTLAIGPSGARYPQCPERWREWVGAADWLQLNETEAQLLGGPRPVEVFAAEVLALGPRGILVTLGARGSFAAWRDGAGIRRLRLPAPHQPQPAYPTGCGDVFGATFAYAALRGVPVERAVELGTEVASLKAGREPLAALGALRTWAARALEKCWPPAA